MKHLSKKELILFYYQDFSGEKLNLIKNHLELCPSCKQELKDIKEVLSNLKFEQPHLAGSELNSILAAVKRKADQSKKARPVVVLQDYSSKLLKGLILIFLRPKVTAIMVSIFLAVFAIYFYNNQADQFSLQVSEVEFDLVIDDEFDLFLDSYNFRNQTYISSSRIISS